MDRGFGINLLWNALKLFREDKIKIKNVTWIGWFFFLGFHFLFQQRDKIERKNKSTLDSLSFSNKIKILRTEHKKKEEGRNSSLQVSISFQRRKNFKYSIRSSDKSLWNKVKTVANIYPTVAKELKRLTVFEIWRKWKKSEQEKRERIVALPEEKKRVRWNNWMKYLLLFLHPPSARLISNLSCMESCFWRKRYPH